MRLRTLNLLAIVVIGVGGVYLTTPAPAMASECELKEDVLVCDGNTGECHREDVVVCEEPEQT
ncbi:MAG TPA: hypothetical protein VF188_11430 [Longimicrobiales bacterium]